eukprot:349376_1
MRNKLSCSSSISCKTLDSLQVPSKVMDILGSRFGRLTNFQQMILKVAAILGWQFHYEELRSTYPIHQHKYRIAEELVILVNSTVIRKIARANQRVAYEFSFGFMRNFLQSMVLGSQKNVLEKLRLEQNKAYDVFRAYLYVYLDYANGGSSWTVMWGELSESSLWLYESKSSRYPHTVIDMCSSKLMENPAVAYEEFENEDRDRRRSLFPDSRPRLSDSGSADDSSHQVSFVVETNLWLCTIRSKQEEENDSPGMDTQVSFKDLVNSPGLMQRMTVPSSPDSLTLKHPTMASTGSSLDRRVSRTDASRIPQGCQWNHRHKRFQFSCSSPTDSENWSRAIRTLIDSNRKQVSNESERTIFDDGWMDENAVEVVTRHSPKTGSSIVVTNDPAFAVEESGSEEMSFADSWSQSSGGESDTSKLFEEPFTSTAPKNTRDQVMARSSPTTNRVTSHQMPIVYEPVVSQLRRSMSEGNLPRIAEPITKENGWNESPKLENVVPINYMLTRHPSSKNSNVMKVARQSSDLRDVPASLCQRRETVTMAMDQLRRDTVSLAIDKLHRDMASVSAGQPKTAKATRIARIWKPPFRSKKYQSENVIQQGYVNVKRAAGARTSSLLPNQLQKGWKKRWAMLFSDCLAFYESREKIGFPSEAICLMQCEYGKLSLDSAVRQRTSKSAKKPVDTPENSPVSVNGTSVAPGSYFVLTTGLWTKGSTLERSNREYELDFDVGDINMKTWVQNINSCIEQQVQFYAFNPNVSRDVTVLCLMDPSPPNAQNFVYVAAPGHHGTFINSPYMSQTAPLISVENAIKHLQNGSTLSRNQMFDILCKVKGQILNSARREFFSPVADRVTISEIFAESNLDSKTKTWLYREFTRHSDDADAAAISKHRSSFLEGGDGGKMTPKNNEIAIPPRISEIPTHQEIDQSELDRIKRWDWSVLDYVGSDERLIHMVVHMFKHFDLLKIFKIARSKFVNFLLEVRDMYRANPYHCFLHGVDVCQTVYSILTVMHGARCLSHGDRFALLLSALTHDIDHPGLNNVFQVNAQTKLAELYNDQSVLENHHTATTFMLLRKHKTLANLPQEKYRSMRRRVVSAILATDMTSHFELLRKFNRRMQDNWDLPEGVTVDTSDELLGNADRELIISVIVHGADISNQCKSWDSAYEWSKRVHQEQRNQRNKEEEMETKEAYRSKFEEELWATSLNFIDFIVAPIFVMLAQFFPKMQCSCTQLGICRREWEKIAVKHITENDKLRIPQKAAELAKWSRRMEAFHAIMVPASPMNAQADFRRDSLQLLENFVEASTRSQIVAEAEEDGETTPGGTERAKRRRSTPNVPPSRAARRQSESQSATGGRVRHRRFSEHDANFRIRISRMNSPVGEDNITE